MNNKILITGASGFIGSHVVEYFCQQNLQPVCLVRPGSDISFLESMPIELRYGDICDLAQMVAASKECSAIIHTAGLVRDWGRYEHFFQTNVVGTLNVLKASVFNKIKQVIVTGSISVYGEEDCSGIKDESSPFRSHYAYFLDHLFPCGMNYYRDSKAEAVREASQYAMEQRLDCTILEPVWVYGEREFHSGFYEYLQTARSKVPFLPGSATNKFHVIYAKDLARAYFLAYQQKIPGVERIIIGNRESELMATTHTLFCREAGFVRPRHMPKWPLYPVAFFLELAYGICHSGTAPLLTRGRLNMMYDNIKYSTSKASSLLNFTSRYSLEEGVRRTVQWYKEKGLI
ncbi:MAG: NAD-dependent epimerase/dehydratase family protein [Proteobacteria bacterium]|nr:NAD-dependent epimerase/dehydratase family protein [Pseudomonadota bacterium]MBU1689064.1 NAD-dependent epimerase/dehydratase family protein [Pseudomonadota bacterium]